MSLGSRSIFGDAERKLERASQHVHDFEAVASAWSKRCPHRPVVKAQKMNEDWRVWVELLVDVDVPPSIPLILGDAIHNLRCALDHAMWSLIGFDGGKQHKQLQFPVGAERIHFEASARGVITPSESVKELLVNLAAYPSGEGELLYAIHSLDRIDKHRTLTPIAHISHMGSFNIINLATDELVSTTPFHSNVKNGPVFVAPKGFGIDIKNHTYPVADIFFSEVDIVPNEPVLPTLLHMENIVREVIVKFNAYTQGGR